MKFLAIPIFLLLSFDLEAQEIFKRTDLLMGSRFDITVVAGDSIEANKNIDLATHEIKRIENVISSWDTSSQTSLINKKAGIEAVHVDSELFDLIERSIQISRITSGSFDISFASMDRIWRFDGTMESLPNEKEVSESIRFVGYQNIELDKESQTVYLPKTGIKIGFGAIGKGYAADKAKEKLVEAGVESGIINASGDMTVWGNQPNGEAWKVAITNPFNKTEAYALLPIYDQAIVTSGSYERFVEINDKRYSHIIDPRTGYPATGLISVTVFAPKAELADALATSVFVMGKDIGLDLINQLIDIECIIVDENGEVYHSTNIEINTQ